MADFEPFVLSFPASRIEDLKARLQNAIYPDELENGEWHYGSPLSDVHILAQHWMNNFNFAKAADFLNQLPHFKTTIQCDSFEPLSIHFVHLRSNHPNAVPLLFSHGWPGSYIEVFKIAEQLTQSRNGSPAFHVVAPSLPNFGFSQGTKKRGFAIEQYAETCHKLMLKLGYNRYVTQGGDWGWYVTRTMSLIYPEHCLATHFNMDVGDPPLSLVDAHPNDSHPLPSNPTERETNGVTRTRWFDQEGFGYNLLQTTKPQTLAYALADSPTALLAWVYEKLHDWTDNYPWTADEICTWLSVYWFSTAGPGASIRIYYEMMHDSSGHFIPEKELGKDMKAATGKPKVTRKWLVQNHGLSTKIGQSHFPRDLRILPSAWTKTLGHVVFDREHEGGGHFAAWERPDDLVEDLRDMFASLELPGLK